MNNHLHSKRGYSLVEVLIALTILMIAVVAPMTIAIKNIESSAYSLQQNTAVFLAQEAIGIIEATRNTNTLRYMYGGSRESVFWREDAQGETLSGLGPCMTEYGCNFDARDPYGLLDADGTSAVACTEDGDNCRMYRDERVGALSRYFVPNEDDVGDDVEETPFTRRVFVEFTDLSGNENYDELVIRVSVEWDSEFLRKKRQTVNLSSVLYNIYRFELVN